MTQTTKLVQISAALNKICDDTKSVLMCVICQETANFPISYACNRHIVCHLCMHCHFDTDKKFNETKYIFNIKCPCCKLETESDENMKGMLPVPCDIVNVIQSTISCSQYKSSETIESICPYCKTHKNLDHVLKCDKRKYTCHQCNLPITSFQQHERECQNYPCTKCQISGLSYDEYQIHRAYNTQYINYQNYIVENLEELVSYPGFQHTNMISHINDILMNFRNVVQHAPQRMPEMISSAVDFLNITNSIAPQNHESSISSQEDNSIINPIMNELPSFSFTFTLPPIHPVRSSIFRPYVNRTPIPIASHGLHIVGRRLQTTRVPSLLNLDGTTDSERYIIRRNNRSS